MTDTRYTPELAADILRCVSEGTPLRQVCRDKGLPESTARGWFRDDRDGLATRYEAARRMQVDAWADEIVLLANRDDLDANDKRVRIDTLKWLCSKLVPRRYGDRLLVAGDAENPLQLRRLVHPGARITGNPPYHIEIKPEFPSWSVADCVQSSIQTCRAVDRLPV